MSEGTTGAMTNAYPKDGGLRKISVPLLEEERNNRDDREYDRSYGYGTQYDDGYNGYDYPCVRIYPVGKLGPKRDHIDVAITPTNNATYQSNPAPAPNQPVQQPQQARPATV